MADTAHIIREKFGGVENLKGKKDLLYDLGVLPSYGKTHRTSQGAIGLLTPLVWNLY